MKIVYTNSGHSLVESMVAIVLLVSVLVPAANFVAQLATQRLGRLKIEALAIGQLAMEEAIENGSYVNQSRSSADDKWVVNEEYKMVDELVILHVSVTRKGRLKPIVLLETARLMPLTNP